MNWRGPRRREPTQTNPLLNFLLLSIVLFSLSAPFLAPAPARAAGGIGITGSLSTHYFQMPQGATMSGPDINVSVVNTGDEQLGLNMYTRAERAEDSISVDGIHVTLSPSESGFMLSAGESRKFLVIVEVDDYVTPGNYRIWVTAEPYRSTGGTPPSIEILPAVRMSADLEVVGEAGTVFVETVGRSGEPIAAVIRLYRSFNNREYEVCYSDIGTLQSKIAPGDFVAKASSKGGEPLAQESFHVAADENKRISLTVDTLYFEGFAANPAYSTETGELGYVQIVYTINNVYQAIPLATVRLVVNFNGELLEGPSIIKTYEPLLVRREGDSFNYRPVDGWKKGTYGFSLQLYTGDTLYASTREATLDVGGGAKTSSWLWIIFVILAVLGVAALGFLIFFLLKKRKKKEEEKPRKAGKKRKEGKPVREAEEPVRRPSQPPPIEEPTGEAAPLASISSLKARMASLGRDQGTGKAAEGEPHVEEEDNPVETSSQAKATGPLFPPVKVEPERPVVRKSEEKGPKGPSSGKHPAQKPPKPPSAQGPAPVKPEEIDVQMSWPPRSVEPPKPPSDDQISWPPKPVETQKPLSMQEPTLVELESDVPITLPPKPAESSKPLSAFEQAARRRMAFMQSAPAPEEAAPADGADEEPAAPETPPSRSSFAEAARLRMEARKRASETGKSDGQPEESQAGEDIEQPPSP